MSAIEYRSVCRWCEKPIEPQWVHVDNKTEPCSASLSAEPGGNPVTVYDPDADPNLVPYPSTEAGP